MTQIKSFAVKYQVSEKGRLTVSCLCLSAGTEPTATDRFKRKIGMSLLPNLTPIHSNQWIQQSFYFTHRSKGFFLHMTHSTCPINGCQCLISCVLKEKRPCRQLCWLRTMSTAAFCFRTPWNPNKFSEVQTFLSTLTCGKALVFPCQPSCKEGKKSLGKLVPEFLPAHTLSMTSDRWSELQTRVFCPLSWESSITAETQTKVSWFSQKYLTQVTSL